LTDDKHHGAPRRERERKRQLRQAVEAERRLPRRRERGHATVGVEPRARYAYLIDPHD
jgi:hypothetical protein